MQQTRVQRIEAGFWVTFFLPTNDPRSTSDLEIKWTTHSAGETRSGWAVNPASHDGLDPGSGPVSDSVSRSLGAAGNPRGLCAVVARSAPLLGGGAGFHGADGAVSLDWGRQRGSRGGASFLPAATAFRDLTENNVSSVPPVRVLTPPTHRTWMKHPASPLVHFYQIR